MALTEQFFLIILFTRDFWSHWSQIYASQIWGLFTMATQLPHHLDLTDQDTSIASHKRSFHKNIMLKSKHIKNLFISHTRGGTPHQTYCRLREETRILTSHINLWRFFKKPPPRSENSTALLQIKNQEPCQNSSPKRIHGPQMIPHSTYNIRTLSQHQITHQKHQEKIQEEIPLLLPFSP